MIERGQMLYDQNNNAVFYHDPKGDWWKWGAYCFRKKSGKDWLYVVAVFIEKIKSAMKAFIKFIFILIILYGLFAAMLVIGNTKWCKGIMTDEDQQTPDNAFNLKPMQPCSSLS